MIEISRVCKIYPGQKTPALNNINLAIENGEFFGLLGPNGAGKTTMIKILATILLPKSGTVSIDGETLSRSRADLKKRLAMMTQSNSLRNDMTSDQIMELQGRLYRVPVAQIHRRSEELLAFCGLDEHRGKIVRKLSGGMKRKLMLCRALLTEPSILILDEPTVGLDPVSRRQIWDLLRSLNARGLTVLLTTHYIEEAQALCDRAALMNRGEIVRLDTPRRLIEELGAVAVEVNSPKGTRTAFFRDKEEALAHAADLTESFLVRNTTLEDVFLSIVGSGLEEHQWAL